VGRTSTVPGTCQQPGCDHERPCPIHTPARPPDVQRENSYRRGYGGKHWHRARAITLKRDQLCTWPEERGGCDAPSTRADHYPRTRRELLAAGVPDPDDPALMRGLCESHHNQHTGETRR
jgi:5-methylcytosine-specific restriction protein A